VIFPPVAWAKNQIDKIHHPFIWKSEENAKGLLPGQLADSEQAGMQKGPRWS